MRPPKKLQDAPKRPQRSHGMIHWRAGFPLRGARRDSSSSGSIQRAPFGPRPRWIPKSLAKKNTP